MEMAEAEARKFGGTHFSASARTGQNVKEVFRGLTERKYFPPSLFDKLKINFFSSFTSIKWYSINFFKGIAAYKADMKKQGGQRKLNTRGMMNVKGIDVNNDDDFSGPKAF